MCYVTFELLVLLFKSGQGFNASTLLSNKKNEAQMLSNFCLLVWLNHI